MSLSRHTDTIVAPITAVGGAVGVVRVSGSSAWEVGSVVFESWPSPVVGRQAVYGRFVHGDDGLVLPFPAGSSYTGEETVEMSVHGSRASVSALVSGCLSAGARMADPGEFTLRAFMNGRIDLTQAEGVRDSVLAATDAQMRQANLLREGALKEKIASIREDVLDLLARIEASTDFSEEIGDLDRIYATNKCKQLLHRVKYLLDGHQSSRVIRDGTTVAIIGPPNAGKSSLFNAVLGSDRAIVTDVPGTTRDTVEGEVEMGGILVRLVDTAGLRETDDPVEAIGVSRTHSSKENADIVWYVFDASRGWSLEDDETWKNLGRPCLVIANKSDMAASSVGVMVSSIYGEGLDEVVRRTVELIGVQDLTALVNSRHAVSLALCLGSLTHALETLACEAADDLLVVDLQAAARSLGEITGETATPDVIERVFHDFCIGK